MKGQFDEAATARLTVTAMAATVPLDDAAAKTSLWSAGAAAIMATPLILGGLGGLAIYRMTGWRASKVPSAVCSRFWKPVGTRLT